MSFPATLDTFPSAATLAAHTLGTDPHSTLHGNLGTAVAALEAKVGVTGSAVPTSHDYKIAQLEAGGGGGALATLGWLNVSDYGAVGNGVTDDTVAIQAAITAAVALGGATIYFPLRGPYLCNGALTGSARQSVLRIPQQDGGTWITIEFRGCAPVAFPFFGSVDIGATDQTLRGAVIKSTGDGGAVLGLEPGSVGGAGFNSSRLVFRNMTILTKDNPTRSGIDAFYALQLELDNVLVTTGKFGFHASQPTTAGIFGIASPQTFNAAMVTLRECLVSGYYDGYTFGELAYGDELFAQSCIRAFVFKSNTLSHACYFGRICDTACVKGLCFDSQSRVYIAQYDAEQSNVSWMTRVYDLDGSGGTPLGKMSYHISQAGTGTAQTSLLVASDANLNYFSATQLGPISRPILALSCSGTAQTIASGAYTAVQWQANVDSSGDGFTWSAGGTDITVNNSGLYAITANVGFAVNAAGLRTLFLRQGNINNETFQGATVPGDSGEISVATLSVTLWLNKGEVISVEAHQTSGSTLAVQNQGGQSFVSRLFIAKVG